ncbi:glycoside hydrolase family 15 protein [Prolixibacter sp. NT017]|uniref:glycoside hydrolase family 15 protein n=1 Tax=Prolixibacter sp. NT017 TaxID=2652390 RepID=UPI00126D0391|nr:glycoside hydrolase family 15 protein [Prolixibacter sp. NT017]GET26782.1 glycosyl hydrolase [Prolixibacter sp. NT017]
MDNLNYGIVGNCKSAALISKDGSLDWLCLPKFDSSSVFGRLLDDEKGGHMAILPEKLNESKQFYLPRTNILCTRFECEDGIFEVHDFMPRYENQKEKYYSPPDIIRYFKHITGNPSFRIIYDPRLEYAEFETKTVVNEHYVKSNTTKGPYDSLYMYTSFDKQKLVAGEVLHLPEDQFTLVSYNQKLLKQDVKRAYLKLMRTQVYWLNWSERTTRFKEYNDEINRSALTLKLLSYEKTGAVLAALTTSLPETIGEERNWDYRFCWIRDASMVVRIMTGLGHLSLTQRYLDFIISLLPEKDERIQIMYGISGEKKLSEKILKHLKGYEGSCPVRIGNAAYKQKQNDIYGILVDVVYQQFKLFPASLEYSEELWTLVRNIVKMVERNWQKPDKGIWEFRNESRHFTFSKVLCWVAIDRAVKIGNLLKQEEVFTEWERLRDRIRDSILKNAWSEEKQSFTQAYGTEDLDASVLLMESYGFVEASDPRFKSTVLAVQRELEHNGLMYRYKNEDDFGEPQSAFTICSFWLINSLYKIGYKEEARERFQRLLSYSNHLGLFSEDLDFKTKRMLGNFPQAYSHLAMIESAITISEGELSLEEVIREAIK